MKVKLITSTENNMLIANEAIGKGEIVVAVHGKISYNPDKYSIQVGEHKHISPMEMHDNASLWCYTNHSCNPTCSFDIDTMSFKALKDIEEGEEITYDYETTEENISNPFNCNCGSLNCKGLITGGKLTS